ncbi:MAG: hypothetical protein HOH95_13125 [Dehalococcoidia bacterium]|nr:hypothetical protein [Dehalococcoidia bacterium]
MAGSLVLAAAAAIVAAWAGFAVAMTPTPVAAVSLSRAIVAVEQPLSFVADASTPAVSLDEELDAVETPPTAATALVTRTEIDPQPERHVGSAAVSSVVDADASRSDPAAAAAVTTEERHAALIARAAVRDNDSPFVEPPGRLDPEPTRAERHEEFVARASTRDNSPPFVEPMRGLSRPATRAEVHAAFVLRAAARGDVPPIIEAAYPIDASVLQTPMLRTGDIVEATISFYYCVQGATSESGDGGAFCGAMRDGTVVYNGAAACDWSYLGQRFIIVGDPLERVYTCADTGSAVHGLHRDIWFHSAEEGWKWQLGVGSIGLLLIVD